MFDIDHNPEKGDNSLPAEIAQKLLVELGLEGKTIVQRTPNNGMHVAIAVPVDPNDLKTISMWEERGLQEENCINNCRVAIKIKYMQISLDPSPHRVKTHLKYQLVHRNLVIAECPQFYFRFIEELKAQKCIPEEDKSYSYKSAQHSIVGRYDFSEKEIEDACAIILGSDNGDFGSIFHDKHNDTTMALGGYCYKKNASLQTAQAFVARLSNLAGDNKLSKRISTLATTYKTADTKGRDEVSGSTVLVKRFKDALKNQNRTEQDKQTLAEYRLRQLNDALNIKSKSSLTKEQLERMEDVRLASKKVTTADINFVLRSMLKEAPYDETSIKQLFYGMASTFTRHPMPHMITSLSAGAGKNYLLELVSKYFPQKYIAPVTRISDKAVFHRSGDQVILSINSETGAEETTPLEEILSSYVADKKDFEEALQDEKYKEKGKRDTQKIKDLNKKIAKVNLEIRNFQAKSQKLINVERQIILCLDSPPESFLDMTMSLLSQDTKRLQQYEFAEKNTSGQMGNKVNLIKGTPNIICTRVTDDTRTERYEERNRRFTPVSPDISAQKISKANDAGWDEDGMLDEEFEEVIDLTSEQKEQCRSIVASVVAKLNLHTNALSPKKTGVKIVYLKSIKSSMPEEKEGEVWHMTVSKRLRKYFATICKINIDNRCRVFNTETKEIMPIPTYGDLKEALKLMVNAASNVRIYQASFFSDTFLPLYQEKLLLPFPEEERKGYTLTEKKKGFASSGLSDAISKLPSGTFISKEDLEKKYLYPLRNLGVLNSVKSQIDNRVNIFFPVQSSKIIPLFEDPNDPRLKITKEEDFPCINIVEEACGTRIQFIPSACFILV